MRTPRTLATVTSYRPSASRPPGRTTISGQASQSRNTAPGGRATSPPGAVSSRLAAVRLAAVPELAAVPDVGGEIGSGRPVATAAGAGPDGPPDRRASARRAVQVPRRPRVRAPPAISGSPLASADRTTRPARPDRSLRHGGPPGSVAARPGRAPGPPLRRRPVAARCPHDCSSLRRANGTRPRPVAGRRRPSHWDSPQP